MKIQVYEALVIRPGLARVQLALYDEDVFQGEYELTIEVLDTDTLEVLKGRLSELLNLAINTPKIVYELAGIEYSFEPRDITPANMLPEYKKTHAE